MLETAALELDIDIQSIGSTTLRRRPRRKGLEPDECYYVQHEAQVRHEQDYDPERDPPPDLAIEVDVEHSSLSRLEIYAGLGVPEVWRYADETLTILRLRRGKYVSIPRSAAFPPLTAKVLQEFLEQRWDLSENQLIRNFISWLRKAT
jgi:Uma2 family endonuclease